MSFLHKLRQASHITILWFGREGKSSYRFLIHHGVDPSHITIREKNEYIWLQDFSCARVYSWADYLDEIYHDEFIFLSPGITAHILQQQWVDISFIQDRIVTQTWLCFQYFPGMLLPISGTKWKTTTAHVVHKILIDAGKKSLLAGNVGVPIFDLYDPFWVDQPEYIVYEVSSYMLESIHHINWQVERAIITTFFPTVHLAEHGGVEKYTIAKQSLIDHSNHCYISQQAAKWLTIRPWQDICNAWIWNDDGVYIEHGVFMRRWVDLFSIERVKLPWFHNAQNLCNVIALAMDMNIDVWSIQRSIETFAGVEHRLEYVGYVHNKHWYNDAIATAPDATIAALRSFQYWQIGVLLAWGVDGTYNFADMAQVILEQSVHKVILFPDSWTKIMQCLIALWFDETALYCSDSMESAVACAKEICPDDHIVLLSCWSPSFSLWSSYEEKGRLFKEAIVY